MQFASVVMGTAVGAMAGTDWAGKSAMVGREAELRSLRNAWLEALRGRGRLVLIGGESGIGKTRLCEEFAGSIEDDPAKVVWSTCYEREGPPMYWPWIQVIRSLATQHETEAVRAALPAHDGEIAEIVPDLRAYILGPTTSAGPQSAHRRFRLFDGIAQFLASLSRRNPLLIIFEDLHGSDPSSLQLLEFFAKSMQQLRVLVVATYRDTPLPADHPLRQMIIELLRLSATQQLALPGLSAADVSRCLELATGAVPPAPLAATLHRQTEGNPLFVLEFARLLMSGREQIGGPKRAGTPPPVPTTVKAILRRRLDPLSAQCREILSVASVLGREFCPQLLQQLWLNHSDLKEPQVVKQALVEAEDAGLCVAPPAETGQYSFIHTLLRQTLYEDLESTQRVRLHRMAGDALVRLGGGDSHDIANTLQLVQAHASKKTCRTCRAYPSEVAHHYAEGGLEASENAIRYALRAAEQASRLLAYEEAVRLYELALRVLDACPEGDSRRRCEILLALSAALRRVGDLERSRATVRQAAAVARQLSAPDLVAHAAIKYRPLGVGLGVTNDEQVRLLQEALESLGEGDSVGRARVLACLAATMWDAPASQGRDALSREAVEMARRLGDKDVIAYALSARELALSSPEHMELRLQAASEHLQLLRGTHDLDSVWQAHVWRVVGFLEQYDTLAADCEIAAYRRLSDELRRPFYQWISELWEAMQALIDGRFAQAELLANGALQLGLRADPESAAAAHAAQMQVLRWEQGQLAELVATMEQLARRDPRHELRSALAFMYAEVGRYEDAKRVFDTLAGNDFAGVPRDMNWLSVMALLASVSVALRDRDRAAVLYRLLLPYAGRNVVVSIGVVCYGAVSRYLGLLAAAMDRWEDAEAHFKTALAYQQRLGAPSFVSRTRVDYAEMLLARGNSQDRAAATELLRQALPVARQLGMAALADKIGALFERMGKSPIPKPGAGPDPARKSATPGTYFFRHEGDYWVLGSDSSILRLRDSKGLQYIARLLQHPGREFLALDLMLESAGQPPGKHRPSELGVERLAPGFGSDILLDRKARLEYRNRLEELRSELQEAETNNDSGRVDRAREEIESITEQMAAAVGWGGHGRSTANDLERARSAVSKRIHQALKKIRAGHPLLGQHLSRSIRTGYVCIYNPDADRPVLWEL